MENKKKSLSVFAFKGKQKSKIGRLKFITNVVGGAAVSVNQKGRQCVRGKIYHSSSSTNNSNADLFVRSYVQLEANEIQNKLYPHRCVY